jgi:hypothetical protein
MSANTFGLLASVWVSFGLTVSAVYRFKRPNSWWSDASFAGRNDPLGWMMRARLARGAELPSEREVAGWSVAQIAFALVVEFPRFRGHLLTEFARSGRMSADAKDPALLVGVPLGGRQASS